MGLKVIIVAAALGLIATSGHAFAVERQMFDGLATSGQVIAISKAKTIRLAPPKMPAPAVPSTPSFPG
jgi:hypothetical protein